MKNIQGKVTQRWMRSPAEPIGGCGYMVNNEEGTVFEQTSTLWASEIAVGLRFQADVVGAFAGFETIVPM